MFKLSTRFQTRNWVQSRHPKTPKLGFCMNTRLWLKTLSRTIQAHTTVQPLSFLQLFLFISFPFPSKDAHTVGCGKKVGPIHIASLYRQVFILLKGIALWQGKIDVTQNTPHAHQVEKNGYLKVKKRNLQHHTALSTLPIIHQNNHITPQRARKVITWN